MLLSGKLLVVAKHKFLQGIPNRRACIAYILDVCIALFCSGTFGWPLPGRGECGATWIVFWLLMACGGWVFDHLCAHPPSLFPATWGFVGFVQHVLVCWVPS